MRRIFGKQKISVNSLNFVNNSDLVYFLIFSAIDTLVKLFNCFISIYTLDKRIVQFDYYSVRVDSRLFEM